METGTVFSSLSSDTLNHELPMPSPSAFSKFVLSVLKFLGIFKFFRCTQNSLGILWSIYFLKTATFR